MEVVRSKRAADIAWAVGIILRVDIEGAAGSYAGRAYNWNPAVTGEAVPGIHTTDISVRLLRLGLWLPILRNWLLWLPLQLYIRMDTTMPLTPTDTR